MEQTTGPAYYRRGTIEVWDFIRDQGLNYHLGNAVKYVCRAGYKESAISDLKKAIHYLENELQHVVERTGDRVPHRISNLEFSFEQDDMKALIDEEWSEFHQAFHFEPEENQLKELADLVYVCYQFAENMEWDLDEAMHRVHRSNMSKLERMESLSAVQTVKY